jgi:hypothetical protein
MRDLDREVSHREKNKGRNEFEFFEYFTQIF